MRKTIVLFSVLALLAETPYQSFAWGKKGHELTAEVAFTILDEHTKAAVQKYLGSTTIEEASTWMDEVRSDHKYDFMKPWHYVNVEKGSVYVPSKEPNIINALNNSISLLEHKEKLTDEEIKTNIMIIFHLAGDFHQPLHVGYGNDKGGNDVQLKYNDNFTNLHRVWDTELIEKEHISLNDCMMLYNKFSTDELSGLKEIDMEKWVYEPRTLLYKVYSFNSDNSIDKAYSDKNKKVIEQQLLVGGIRLAAILEKLFS